MIKSEQQRAAHCRIMPLWWLDRELSTLSISVKFHTSSSKVIAKVGGVTGDVLGEVGLQLSSQGNRVRHRKGVIDITPRDHTDPAAFAASVVVLLGEVAGMAPEKIVVSVSSGEFTSKTTARNQLAAIERHLRGMRKAHPQMTG